MNDPLITLFGRAADRSGQALQHKRGQMSFLQDPNGLPPNVHLLTLKDNGDGRILLRLAHLFQVLFFAIKFLLTWTLALH